MFIRTERLLLRPGWAEDAPLVADALNDEGVVRMLARAPWPYLEADAAHWLSMESDSRHPNFLVFLRGPGTPRLIGSCGLGKDDLGRSEIGYWIRRSHWGLGFATEAGRAVMDVARSLGHRRLHSGYFTDNPASGHVLYKLGFRSSGEVEPRFSRGRGENASCIIMSADLDQSVEASDPYSDDDGVRMAA
jgi:RimJ/RimL family protein N-acetyltransferase